MWIVLAGAAVGVVVSYLAIRIGLGLLREPAEGRRAGEIAVWLGIPVVWLALSGINLLLTEGQDDVSFFGGCLPQRAPYGVLSWLDLRSICDPNECGAISINRPYQPIPVGNTHTRIPSRSAPPARQVVLEYPDFAHPRPEGQPLVSGNPAEEPDVSG